MGFIQQARALKSEQVVNARHAAREARQSKCNFCLGFSSVFLAVVVVAVASTTLTYTPIFFLKIAELTSGEADLIISPSARAGAVALDYRRIHDYFDGTQYQYSSPRYISNVITNTLASCTPGPNYLNRTELYDGLVYSPGFTYPFHSLVSASCPNQGFSSLYAIDFEKEAEIGIGRTWTLPAPPPGSVYLSDSIARGIHADVGDTIFLEINMDSILRSMVNHSISISPTFFIPVTVAKIYTSGLGKYGDKVTSAILISYNDFFSLVKAWKNPSMPPEVAQALDASDPWGFSTSIIFNLPPPRLAVYADPDYDAIETKVVSFANNIISEIGFGDVDATMDILSELSLLRFLALFLGLVISLIVLVIALMLALLIYSLLIISVETRAFDLGVMRMVGMTRGGVVRYVLMQTAVIATPAWIVGLVVAAGATSVILSALGKITATTIPLGLSASGVQWASAMGLLVPVAASILPVRAALTQSLNDALDVNRSKTPGVIVSINRSSEARPPMALLLTGVVLTTAGVMTYYFFPLALLYGNLQLLLGIFLGLLVGMLLGLVMLGLNLERTVEFFIVYIFLRVWNSRAVIDLVLKNLIAHRLRNRKTSIMYSLSLGFIIFITVSFATQVDSLLYNEERRNGGLLTLRVRNDGTIPLGLYAAMDKFAEDIPEVGGISWYSQELRWDVAGLRSTDASNVGKTFRTGLHIIAVSPNFFDIASPGFLDVDQESSSVLSLSEQLYTPRGSQSMMMGTVYEDYLTLDLNSTFLVSLQPSEGYVIPNNTYNRVRPLCFLSGSPKFTFSRYPNVRNQDALVSFPTLMRLSNGKINSVSAIPMAGMLIKIGRDVPLDRFNQIKLALADALNTYSMVSVYNFYDATLPWETALSAIDFFAVGSSLLVMIVCFFSLSSSMYANIHEQSKELGVLRAIGVKKWLLVKVYVLEAFVLVVAAASVGILIGCVIGYTVTAQRAVFTQLPIPFRFPYKITGLVFLISVFSAIFSALLPAIRLLRLPIVKVLRSV